MTSMDMDVINNTQQSEMDKRLAVKFYKKAVFNKFKSKEEGRNIYDDKEYISILIPGDNTSKIDRPSTDKDRRRFEVIYERYLKKEDDVQNGTPLELLPTLSPAQIENFKSYKVYTVEQLAGLGEHSIQKIPQARNFVADANKFLEGDKYVKILESKIESLELELAALKGKENESTNNNTKRVSGNRPGRRANNSNRK